MCVLVPARSPLTVRCARPLSDARRPPTREQNGEEQLSAIHQFMLQLVLNHTIVLETIRDEDDNVIGTQISASSPDEEAFVNAGQSFGYRFVNRSKDLVTVDIAGQGERVYRVVCMLPYTQVRVDASTGEAVPSVCCCCRRARRA